MSTQIAFERAVEAELMRHGFPSLHEGHERGLWLGIPNELALAHPNDDPLEVAREIMWWHDATTLRLPN